MRSVMNHSFATVPQANIARSQFDLSHGHKTAIDADYIYPLTWMEVVPGDTFNVRSFLFARMTTPIFPIMDNLHLDHFWFYIPDRLVHANFHKLLGAQDDPGDSIDFTFPTMTSTTSTGYAENSLHDYLGIPPGIPDLVHRSGLHRAYNLIFREWFRDQNLTDSPVVDTDDGPDTPTDYVLLKRAKRHDYFTSCLPNPQKLDTAVSLPLGTSAPVIGTNEDTDFFNTNDTTERQGWMSTGGATSLGVTTSASTSGPLRFSTTQVGLEADLSNATAATINAIRLAVTTQQFLERDARGGTRINEIIRSHFNVTVPDYRVQRPEYLGGGTTMVNVHQIPQTSESNTTPQGTMSAYATANINGDGFTKAFTEFGIIMCLVNVRADLTYDKGLNKYFTRQTRYDLYWPEFANLGEQAVLQQEIEVTDPAGGTNEDVFGYQERYAEYRFQPSRISAQFRTGHSSTLSAWTLTEALSTPALNNAFIESNTPMSRVLAVADQPDFIVDCYFDVRATRPMPVRGTPGLARF
jgi:hypothetical protein